MTSKHDVQASPDGTVKFLLQLFDGRLVETVGIPADTDGGGRLTVCVSSQVAVLLLPTSLNFIQTPTLS